MVRGLAPQVISEAAVRLGKGETFDYPKSTKYDAVLDGGTPLPPKAVIGPPSIRSTIIPGGLLGR